MRWKRHLTCMVGKPERKRLLGRTVCRQEDNIRIYLKETGWEGVE